MRSIATILFLSFFQLLNGQFDLVYYSFDSCGMSPTYTLNGFTSTDFYSTNLIAAGCTTDCPFSSGCIPGSQASSLCSSTNRSFNTKGWDGLNMNPNKYHEFTLSTYPGVSFFLSSLTFNYTKSNQGPLNMRVYVDGQMVSMISTESNSCRSIGVGIGLNRVGSTNIRIYFWGAPSSDGTIRVDNVRLTSNFTTLPVELIDFKAYLKSNSIVLDWSTGSEVDNSHFVIQKSKDGINFEEVGEIDGVGNSNSLSEYTFIDREMDYSLVYYRLKQVDFNGDYSYSNIVPINIDLILYVRNGMIYYTGKDIPEVFDIYGRKISNLISPYKPTESGILIIRSRSRIWKIWI
jgi:hypothetical protein